jgi:hypothetical protein
MPEKSGRQTGAMFSSTILSLGKNDACHCMMEKGLSGTHGREQHLDDSYHTRSDEHNEDCREDEKNQWKDQLDGRFGGFFLGDLTPFDTHGIRVDAQGLG